MTQRRQIAGSFILLVLAIEALAVCVAFFLVVPEIDADGSDVGQIAIVGAAVGGIGLYVVLAVATVLFWKHRRS